MAQTGTVYEYVDDQGATHQVDSIKQVPKKYYRTMMAIGPETVEQETHESWGFGFEGFDLGAMTEQTGVGAPVILVAVVAAIICLRTKDFAMRVASGTVAAGLLFFTLYTWGETSGLLRTSEKKRPIAEAKTDEE